MSEFLGRKMVVPLAVVSCLGNIAGCGQTQGGGEQTSASSTSSAAASQELQDCNGLPSYRKIGADPDPNHAYLQVEKGTDCKTPMYDLATGQNIGEYIGPDTEFWACYQGANPMRFEVTIVKLQETGAEGTVNLGDAAGAQFRAANNDVPACAP